MLLNWCFCDWTIANGLALIGIILSLGGFILAIIAYNKFLIKPFREKQLQVVCDLIKQINDEWNHFTFKNVEHTPLRAGWGNIFDLAEFPEINENIDFYTFAEEDEGRFYQDRGIVGSGMYDSEDQRFDDIIAAESFRFHNNPLLPITIAQVLKKFSLTDTIIAGNKTLREIRKEDKYVIMGKKKRQDDNTICYYYNDKRRWKDYINICKALKKAILQWGEKYGLDDLNITISHNFKTE